MSSHTLVEEIDSFLKSVESTKAAESTSEEGHVQNQGDSGTAHPSKSVDDGTQDATEGARSAENTADVKSDVPGQPVDEAKEDRLDGASETPLSTAKPTGEDPANETSSVSGMIGGDAGKDSQGKDTAHPAKADFGGKYASAKEAAINLMARINSFNAKIAALDTSKPEVKKVAEAMTKNPSAASVSSDGAKKAKVAISAVETNDDVLAGEKAAEVAASQLGLIGDVNQQELVTNIAKEAFDDANALCDLYVGMAQGNKEASELAAKKKANIPVARKQASALLRKIKKAMEGGNAGADALAYGGEGEQPNAMGEGMGAPPEGKMPMPGGEPSGSPMMSGGEMGGEEMGEGEMGGEMGGGDEATVMKIIQELQAAGIDPEVLANIDPEDLAQAIAEAQGGEMGGGMMGGGEMGGAMMGGEKPGMPGGEMGGGGEEYPPERGAAGEMHGPAVSSELGATAAV